MKLNSKAKSWANARSNKTTMVSLLEKTKRLEA